MSSDLYKEWIKEAKLNNLTNTQVKFAEWLLQKEQIEQINKIGDLTSIFISVRKFVKENNM